MWGCIKGQKKTNACTHSVLLTVSLSDVNHQWLENDAVYAQGQLTVLLYLGGTELGQSQSHNFPVGYVRGAEAHFSQGSQRSLICRLHVK